MRTSSSYPLISLVYGNHYLLIRFLHEHICQRSRRFCMQNRHVQRAWFANSAVYGCWCHDLHTHLLVLSQNNYNTTTNTDLLYVVVSHWHTTIIRAYDKRNRTYTVKHSPALTSTHQHSHTHTHIHHSHVARSRKRSHTRQPSVCAFMLNCHCLSPLELQYIFSLFVVFCSTGCVRFFGSRGWIWKEI